MSMNYARCMLEKAKKQYAIIVYEKNGYKIIPNYDQYAEMGNSICYEKEIKTKV